MTDIRVYLNPSRGDSKINVKIYNQCMVLWHPVGRFHSILFHLVLKLTPSNTLVTSWKLNIASVGNWKCTRCTSEILSRLGTVTAPNIHKTVLRKNKSMLSLIGKDVWPCRSPDLNPLISSDGSILEMGYSSTPYISPDAWKAKQRQKGLNDKQ